MTMCKPRFHLSLYRMLIVITLLASTFGRTTAAETSAIAGWPPDTPIVVVPEESMLSISEAMPASDISYNGASPGNAFVAIPPYTINIMGTAREVNLGGSPRSFDFSGAVPFLNPIHDVADPGVFQGWDSSLSASRNMAGQEIGNQGLAGRIEKRGSYTMVRYKAGDGITAGRARTQIVSYPIPPRTHVQWDLALSFGAADGENEWDLTTPGASPVLFWQVKSPNGVNPSMAAVVDTDPYDPTRSLMLTFSHRGGKATTNRAIVRVHNIPRHTIVPITIEAYLDERETADGGKGRQRIWIGNRLVADIKGPTLTWGSGEHKWMMNMYLYNEPTPVHYNRASFWQTARMIVFP